MRVWDDMLLGQSSSVVQHDRVTVGTSYTLAGQMYADLLQSYEVLGTNLFLLAVVSGNVTSTNALRYVYVTKSVAWNYKVLAEVGRTVEYGSTTSAELSAGSTLDIYYVAFNSADEVYDKDGVYSVALEAEIAYSLSSTIYSDFVAANVAQLVPSGHKYAAILLPDAPKSVKNYLTCMSYNNLYSENGKFMRYNNTVYGISSSYAAKLDSGDTLKLVIFDYTDKGG